MRDPVSCDDFDQATDSTTYLSSVGARVRAARKRRNLSRRALSVKSGVSERFIAQLEGGRGNISILRLKAIADSLQMAVIDFLADRQTPSTVTRPSVDTWTNNSRAIAELFEYADPQDKAAIVDLLLSSTQRRRAA
ncbi:MAG: helix-turn-helix domain-containing protein [Pseudomonadota bacterium]